MSRKPGFAEIERRSALVGLAATSALLFAGCGRSATSQSEKTNTSRSPAPGIAPQLAAMNIYRDPGCGCCEEWAERARKAGFTVMITDSDDMPGIKRQRGVPEELASCHTTTIGTYVVEGHVPLDDVRRLLKKGPPDIKGIAVAGMPRGSPGMEMPDGSTDPFKVMAFDAAGRMWLFRG